MNYLQTRRMCNLRCNKVNTFVGKSTVTGYHGIQFLCIKASLSSVNEESRGFSATVELIDIFESLLSSECLLIMEIIQCRYIKISPVGDWRSTSLEWRFSILDRCRPYRVWHCVEHHSPTFAYVAILCRIKLSFYRRHFLPSSESRDTKSRTNIKNPAWSNLDIVL